MYRIMYSQFVAKRCCYYFNVLYYFAVARCHYAAYTATCKKKYILWILRWVEIILLCDNKETAEQTWNCDND